MDTNEIIKAARILIADDDPGVLSLLDSLFRRSGYSDVRTTADGGEVAALCSSFSPDLLVLDMHMPPYDGLDILEEIRPLTRGPHHLPVIVLTGDTAAEVMMRAFLVGARDFVTKPFDAFEFMLRVRLQLQDRFRSQARAGERSHEGAGG